MKRRLATLIVTLVAGHGGGAFVWWQWIVCDGKSKWESADTYETVKECREAGEADKAERKRLFPSTGSASPGCSYLGFKCLPPNLKP